MRRRSSAAATAPATSSTDAMAPMPTSPHASRLLTGGITVTADAVVDDVVAAAAAATAAAASSAAAALVLVLPMQAEGEAGDVPSAAAASVAAVGDELIPTSTEPPDAV